MRRANPQPKPVRRRSCMTGMHENREHFFEIGTERVALGRIDQRWKARPAVIRMSSGMLPHAPVPSTSPRTLM